jgi:hypothetical protein
MFAPSGCRAVAELRFAAEWMSSASRKRADGADAGFDVITLAADNTYASMEKGKLQTRLPKKYHREEGSGEIDLSCSVNDSQQDE